MPYPLHYSITKSHREKVDYMCLTVTALALTSLCLGQKTQKSSPQTKLGVVSEICPLCFTVTLLCDIIHSSLQRIPQYIPIIKSEEGQKMPETKTVICQKR